MYTGAALYQTESISPTEAFRLGEAFFHAMGVIKITDGGYYKLLEDGDHDGDFDLEEVSAEALKEKLYDGEADTFWLYGNVSDPWSASFHYATGRFGSFPHIQLQFAKPLKELYPAITGWLKEAAQQFSFPYGILYEAASPIRTLNYAEGHNLTTLFPNENGFAWSRETPGLYEGQARYTGQMLRMVYPCNLLNHRHLHLQIGDTALKDWIFGMKTRGSLIQVGDDMWMWEAPSEQLAELNKTLGEAGLLVAWRPEAPRKAKRRLP
ncbi:hypothetical protein ACE3NQ_09505 [Paenibacillus terreus]|uniref:Uncharacterized protein n=1 Tax=Paenibacillus terreus TaxID=1387834 RepID=A0ABV5B6I3_9BACL